VTTTISAPDFLVDIITPGTYDESDRRELRALAIKFIVDHQKMQRAGDTNRMYFLLHLLPAIEHAVAAGWDRQEIHADGDRAYAQWLIDNAGR